jgi:predicted O-methyltransferase YrrM
MTHPSVEHFTRAMQFKGLAPCPQDGRWEIPTDSDICTEVETLALVFGFVRTLKPFTVVETGCNVGCMSQAISSALMANGVGMLYTCDIETKFTDATRVRELLCCTVINCDGVSLVGSHPEADLYWIDSSEESCALELECIRLHGKPGAIVLVHDTSQMGYLTEVVRSFHKHVLIPGPRGLGVITL